MMYQVDAEEAGGAGYQDPVVPCVIHSAKVIHLYIGSVNSSFLPESDNTVSSLF